MATIALYANKINQMPGMIKDVKQTVSDYKSELFALKTKTLTINKNVCNLDDVINSIQTSSQTQEQKIASLDTFNQNSETFISDVVRIDSNVADVVKQRKDDFYDTYYYLKPDCEKDWLESTRDWFDAADEWCREHWKEIVITAIIVVGAILAIAAVVCTGGMALAPIMAAGLTALGVSAGTALTIATVTSLTVATIAATSTLASSTLNIINIWRDMSNNLTFKAWQTAMNWTSAISNGFYSIGSIYNSVKGISNASLQQYGKSYLTDSSFRDAIKGADSFAANFGSNTSTFWAGLGKDGASVSNAFAANNGGATLGSSLDAQGIPLPSNSAQWNQASASMAMNSSGNATAVLGTEIGSLTKDGTLIGRVWLNTENILLNINPNIISLTLINNYGTLTQTTTFIPRVFEIGSLFSSLFNAGQIASNMVNEEVDVK